jgi:hypothetical protein
MTRWKFGLAVGMALGVGLAAGREISPVAQDIRDTLAHDINQNTKIEMGMVEQMMTDAKARELLSEQMRQLAVSCGEQRL